MFLKFYFKNKLFLNDLFDKYFIIIKKQINNWMFYKKNQIKIKKCEKKLWKKISGFKN